MEHGQESFLVGTRPDAKKCMPLGISGGAAKVIGKDAAEPALEK
jgi:hypothetical protein